eukprot:TRINITY_DN64640_c0_g1_i1.p1 TRINITY_DN64640_c0_g1~~TRINITY_DN64640_c0_g1_i1.p1  ORF type:complete len:787 (+),score=148.63 TRINITY_DN64640_c0_g1_i1:108-2363(+)
MMSCQLRAGAGSHRGSIGISLRVLLQALVLVAVLAPCAEGLLAKASASAALATEAETAASATTEVGGSNFVRMVLLRDLQPRPFSLCLLQRNENLPWLRLMLRASGSPMYNETRDRLANEAANDKLEIIHRDVARVFRESRRPMFKAVVVRDPVTRLLSSFLNTCRNEGSWDECRGSSRTATFDEVVGNLAKASKTSLSPEFRPQMGMCYMRKTKYDFVAHFEYPERDSEALLQAAGLWEKYGKSGWGGSLQDKFSDIFEGDHASQKVCEFYTPELLDQVGRIYAEDFKSFGYDIETWKEKCSEEWGPAGGLGRSVMLAKAAESVAAHARPMRHAIGLESHSGCAPTETELSLLARATEPKSRKAKARFYVHNSGIFNFSSVVKCFLRANHVVSEWGWMWDDHMLANISEHLGEMHLLRAFENHPQRTMDPSEATFHVVGITPFVSYTASNIGGHPCGTYGDHMSRMEAVQAELANLEEFQRTKGQNFFVFTTHFRIEEIYTPKFLGFAERTNLIFGTGDKQYTHWKPYPNIWRKVLLPYKAHYYVDDAAWAAKKHFKETGGFAHETRKIGFLFRGKISRSNEGQSRSVLWRLNKELQGVDIQDAKFFKQSLSETTVLAKEYLKSKFCLVPAGDTPTSRRLYDALAAGCIPISLGNYEQLADNLPFTRSIDWTRIMLFAGSLQCIEKDDGQTTRWMNWLTSVDKVKLERMAKAGRENYRHSMSYSKNGWGIVNAVLLELEQMLHSERKSSH